ncbi:homogentisate 1,2-dioxygenase [Metarhizium brunneum]
MASATKSNEYQQIFHWAETQKNGAIPSFHTRKSDPYQYQAGFGNSFSSEAVPGTLPQGQNNPRHVRFGLYAEQITATAFVAPRHVNRKAWLYRVRPAVAHDSFVDIPQNAAAESNYLLSNPKVHISPSQLAWTPMDIPDSGSIDFVAGIKSIAGSGEPTLGEGLAIHVYTANCNMAQTAFVNADGDFLIVPQQGALDVQTEFGKMFVQPGEIAVIQKGIRFRVELPDGPSRGYMLEIWGSSFELPELGPLGANGLANARDFLTPEAFYEVKKEPWEIIFKVCGKQFKCTQDHSPFDVVAWHGNYVPFKYDLTKFVNVGSISVDHIDPSIFCVLTAKSRNPAAPLADFLIFSPRWDVASHTYRPPYFHRNSASELMGLIYGDYGGRSDDFRPGSISYECGMVPHGVAYEEFKQATDCEPPVMQISTGSVAFMFESSRAFTITDYAWTSDKMHEHEPRLWNDLEDHFSAHLEEVEKLLAETKAR